MIREMFKSENKDKKALFNKPKRFPGKDKNDDYFPPIKVLRVPFADPWVGWIAYL